MDEPVVLRVPTESARLVLHPPSDPYGDNDFRVLRIEMTDDGLTVDSLVQVGKHDDPPLDTFLHGLAASWRGWAGIERWQSLERNFALDARHDGRGLVTLGITVRHRRITEEALSIDGPHGDDDTNSGPKQVRIEY